MKHLMSLCLLIFAPFAVSAKPLEGGNALRAEVSGRQSASLPAGIPIMLQMMQTVTTEGDSWRQGDSFSMKVSEDVLIGEHVVIPRGTLAFGHVRWSTGRSVFGKSGKIEVEIDHLVLGGREVPLTGVHRRVGSGGLTSAASAMAAGLFVPFITGKSGEIAEGSVMQAFLMHDLRVVLENHRPTSQGHGAMAPVVRSRQISVAEAFSGEGVTAGPDRNSLGLRRRTTVSEAFDKEIRSLELRR